MAQSNRPRRLPLSEIVRDEGIQSRVALRPEVVRGYAELMADGTRFPPVLVFYDGSVYRLVDGFHRLKACRMIQSPEIEAEVRHGTYQEAQWCALQCNGQHGYPRSHGDIVHSFRLLTAHPNSRGMSNRSVARHLNIAESTVRRLRKELGIQGEPCARTVTRGGKQYSMNTDRIGVPRENSSFSERRRYGVGHFLDDVKRLRLAASEDGRAILNVIHRWLEGSCTSSEFLAAVELVTRRLGLPKRP